jgi:hypothetical protein
VYEHSDHDAHSEPEGGMTHAWRPFGIEDPEADEAAVNGTAAPARIVHLRLRGDEEGKDRAGKWLRNAMLALAVLAAAAAAVSYQAQYALIEALKHARVIATLQAGIPDVGAAVFACLGIALALQGRRAVRARGLNLVCVGVSLAMNALAAQGGWRPLAVWTMAPLLYALASDTLIGVIRAYAIARQRALSEALADEETTPLATLGGALLWLLRLALAPGSTLSGFRSWVIEECPVAPGRHGGQRRGDIPQLPAGEPKRVNAAAQSRPRAIPAPRGETKTARFLALVEQQHGPLAQIPLGQTARLAGEVAAEVELHPGAARTALRSAVQAAQQAGSAS